MAWDKELKGKVVLITGASSGIGAETAIAFARRGCRIALAARREDRLRLLAADCRRLGGETILLTTDVANSADCAAAVETTLRSWGTLSILINNAGVNEYKPFAAQEIEAMEAIIRINLMGTIYMTRAALPFMLARREGHVLNVSSIAGLRGLPGMAVYCASKAAVVALTESLRVECRGRGVTFTSFCPGSVDTPMMAAAPPIDPELRRRFRPKSATEVAERIVRATIRRTPEVVFGELPGALVHLSHLFPELSDAAIYKGYKRVQPQAFEF